MDSMPLAPPPLIDSGLGLVVQPLQYSGQPRQALLTCALAVSGTPSLAVAQTAINAFQSRFNADLLPSIDSEVTAEPPSIKLGDGSTTPYEAVGTGAATAGGSSNNTPPPSVNVLVKKTTGLGGKHNRGRWYIPWTVDVSHVSELGGLDNTFISGYQPHINTFFGHLTADSIPMCISNKIFNVPLPPHYVTHIVKGPLVTAMTVEPVVASQRRRVRN